MADTLNEAFEQYGNAVMLENITGEGIVNEKLSINPVTREINVPMNESLFGVYTDKDVERKYFTCPRYVGDYVDLSQCFIFVNYVTASGNYGQYLCDDVTVVGENIEFTWLLSGNVFDSNKESSVYFAVQAKSADSEGNLKNRFNTKKAIGQTYSTIESSEQIEEQYADVILQIISRIETLEQSGTGGAVSQEQIQEAVNNYFKENPSHVGEYKWLQRGYMRDNVRDFQGWAHCVRYDKALGKAVGIVISGTGSHSNTAPYYRVEIDPSTGYMSEYKEVVVNYPDGAEYTDCGYIGSFVIKPDGTYWMCDYYKRIFKSSDKGYTWDYVGNITLGRSTYNNDFLFGAIRLSNGYMVAGNGGQPAAETYYSTDDGVTWNVVTMDCTALGNQVYPEGNYKPFEPFFVECGDGKVIQYARASMSAYATGTNLTPYTVQEAAVYSVSEDYGLTWSAWQWSNAITNMTACNGMAVVIGDKVHAVYGSRYDAEDNDFHLFYATTTLSDILSDKWEMPIIIEVGHWDTETATNSHDCGYPSLFADENNNLFAIYYDSDGTGSAYGANWRLCVGTPDVAPIVPVSGGSGSKNVGYTQSDVDALLGKQKSYLMGFITDLYAKIGEMPPDSGDYDGSFYATDGLVDAWTLGDLSTWDVDAKTNTGVAGHIVTGASAPVIEETSGLVSAGNIVTSDNLSAMGITNEFTLERVCYGVSNDECVFRLSTTNAIHKFKITTGFSNWVYELIDGVSTKKDIDAFNYQSKAVKHFVVTVTANLIEVYVNNVLLRSVTPSENATKFDVDAIIALNLYLGIWGKSYCGDFRIYNKVLSAEQINNNYIYSSNRFALS